MPVIRRDPIPKDEERFDTRWKELKDRGQLYGKYKRGLGPRELRSLALGKKRNKKRSN